MKGDNYAIAFECVSMCSEVTFFGTGAEPESEHQDAVTSGEYFNFNFNYFDDTMVIK